MILQSLVEPSHAKLLHNLLFLIAEGGSPLLNYRPDCTSNLSDEQVHETPLWRGINRRPGVFGSSMQVSDVAQVTLRVRCGIPRHRDYSLYVKIQNC